MLTGTSNKDRILDNALVVGITELIFMIGGMHCIRAIILAVSSTLDLGAGSFGEFMTTMITLACFLIPIAFCLIYMRITKPQSLKVFTRGDFQRRLRSLLAGLLIGFFANGLISLLAGLTGAVNISFQSFNFYLILILPFVFIQCTCEEVLLRGYVPVYLKDRHDWSSIAFVSGTLFIFHHYRNLEYFGFSSAFCVNVFLTGVMLYLMVLVNGNFWICCGFHTAWNYTQQCLFGLPNSGQSSSFALFHGTESKDTFFYNSVYGNEGSWMTTIVLSLLIVALLYLLYHGRKPDRNRKHNRSTQ